MHKVISLIICFIFVSQLVTISFAEDEFRFTNWPLQDFEKRQILNPLNKSNDKQLEKKQHFGVDIQAEVGEKVKAVADGIVLYTQSDYPNSRNGNLVSIKHKNGWNTTYMHLSEKSVKRGQGIKAGEEIGRVGVTGEGRDSEQPHLHLGLITDPNAKNFEDRYSDPLLFGPLPVIQPQDKPVTEVEPSVVSEKPAITPGMALQPEVISSQEIAVETPILQPTLIAAQETIKSPLKPEDKLKMQGRISTKNFSRVLVVKPTEKEAIKILPMKKVVRQKITQETFKQGSVVIKNALSTLRKPALILTKRKEVVSNKDVSYKRARSQSLGLAMICFYLLAFFLVSGIWYLVSGFSSAFNLAKLKIRNYNNILSKFRYGLSAHFKKWAIILANVVR